MVMLLGEAETEYGKHIAKISNRANSFMPIAYHASRNSFWCRLYAHLALDPCMRFIGRSSYGILSNTLQELLRLHLAKIRSALLCPAHDHTARSHSPLIVEYKPRLLFGRTKITQIISALIRMWCFS